MTDKTIKPSNTNVPKKRGRPKKSIAPELIKSLEEAVSFTFPDKKTGGLKGMINTGTLFIGDAGYFAGNPQDYSEGIITPDPSNPFKDWDRFYATHENDCNLELPGSFNGDLPGRGVVIQTHMMSGSYSVEKEIDPQTGKLISVKVLFRD